MRLKNILELNIYYKNYKKQRLIENLIFSSAFFEKYQQDRYEKFTVI